MLGLTQDVLNQNLQFKKRCPGDSNAHSSWGGTDLDCPPGEGISVRLLWREIRGWATLIQETEENLNWRTIRERFMNKNVH